MTTATMQGFGKDFVDRAYPLADRGIPVLNSFYFSFGDGGRKEENDINQIMLLPGGASTDLTPTADFNPSSVPAGRAELRFADDDPTDDEDKYFYRAAHVMLNGRFARRFQFRDVGDVNRIRRPLPRAIVGPAHTPTRNITALAGFSLRFTGNRDHHIDQITVMLEDDDTITLALNDKSHNDVFAYLIDVVRISGAGMNITPGEASGSALGGGGARVNLPRSAGMDFVLRGFHFDFKSKDHPLHEVGVMFNGDNLSMFFGDEGADDAFNWRARWAYIGPQVVSP